MDADTEQRRPRSAGERGQSLVELALILPALVLIFFIVADFSRLFATEVAFANAARDAARYGSTASLDDSAIKQRVYDEIGTTPDWASSVKITNVTIARAASGESSTTKTITVNVQYQFSLLTPVLPGGTVLTLSNAATMPII